MKLNLFSILTCLFIFISCENEKEVVHTLDPEMIDYYASCNNGSWWVYENADDLTTDSMYVYDYEKKREGNYGGHEWNEFIMYKLNYDGHIIWAQLFAYNDSNTCFSYITPDNTPDFTSTFDEVCSDDLKGNSGNTGSSGVTILTSFTVNDSVYHDIIKSWAHSDTFYFAKNIGLIQFETNEGLYKLIKSKRFEI